MLPNVKQKTIKPIIEAMVVRGTMIYTDEYSIYARLPVWGYQHKTVCHSPQASPHFEGWKVCIFVHNAQIALQQRRLCRAI